MVACARAIATVDSLLLGRHALTKVACNGCNWTGAIGLRSPVEIADSHPPSTKNEDAVMHSVQVAGYGQQYDVSQLRTAVSSPPNCNASSRPHFNHSSGDTAPSAATTERSGIKSLGGKASPGPNPASGKQPNSARKHGKSTMHQAGANRSAFLSPAEEVAKAIEICVGLQTAITSLNSAEYFGPLANVEIGAGVSAGSASVIGFLGQDVSAISWTMLGDATAEARGLAE